MCGHEHFVLVFSRALPAKPAFNSLAVPACEDFIHHPAHVHCAADFMNLGSTAVNLFLAVPIPPFHSHDAHITVINVISCHLQQLSGGQEFGLVVKTTGLQMQEMRV